MGVAVVVPMVAVGTYGFEFRWSGAAVGRLAARDLELDCRVMNMTVLTKPLVERLKDHARTGQRHLVDSRLRS